MHCGPPNQNCGWALAHPAYAVEPPWVLGDAVSFFQRGPEGSPTAVAFCCIECFQNAQIWTHRRSIFTVRRNALHGICYRNSVCLSVRPSVCLSVTLVDCVHMVRPTIMISSPQGSSIILVSGDITIIPKFEGGHPTRGR